MTFQLSNWPTADNRRHIWQYFGENVELYRKRLGLEHGHNGIDIGVYVGDPIYAAADGEVIESAYAEDGFGNFVVIAHQINPLITTVYAHMQQAAVMTGDSVDAGELIGWGGSTGWSTGPHLHFGLRVDHVDVDPWPYLQGLKTEAGPDYDGWLWKPGMIIVTGEAPAAGLNLRRTPSTGGEFIRTVEVGERFDVVGAEVNEYLPVRILD